MVLVTPLVFLLLLFVLIDIGLIIFSLYDLTRPERRVRGDNKLLWGVIILFFNLFGPLLYVAIGRERS